MHEMSAVANERVGETWTPNGSALAQVNQYLSDQPYIDPQTPHFIDIGGNDILALLLSVRRPPADLACHGRPARACQRRAASRRAPWAADIGSAAMVAQLLLH